MWTVHTNNIQYLPLLIIHTLWQLAAVTIITKPPCYCFSLLLYRGDWWSVRAIESISTKSGRFREKLYVSQLVRTKTWKSEFNIHGFPFQLLLCLSPATHLRLSKVAENVYLRHVCVFAGCKLYSWLLIRTKRTTLKMQFLCVVTTRYRSAKNCSIVKSRL